MSLVSFPAPARARIWAPRNLAVPLALLALVILLLLVGRHGDANATLPAEVRLVSTSDPMNIGAATAATLVVRNNGDHAIRPRFSLSWLPYPYYWRVVSGPETLPPGVSATYAIEAPDSTAAPHDGEPFQIKVNDATSITYAVSETITRARRDLAVANPALRFWTERDPTTNLVAPAGWSVYARTGGGDQAVAEEADVFGVHAARFHVVQDGQPDPGGWSHAGLTQEVAFPARPFDIEVLSQTRYDALPEGWPLTAFGIEIADKANGLVWLLFEPTGHGDLSYDLPSGHHIEVYDVPESAWTRRTVDLAAIYERLGWRPPKDVTLKLFAAAASSKAADVQGYVREISLPGEQHDGCRATAADGCPDAATSSTQATP